MLNLGILISGRGSNMKAILSAVLRGQIQANPAVVISNRPDAAGLKFARRIGVRTEVVDSRSFAGSRSEYDRVVMSVLERHGVTPEKGLVCLAGFMRIITPEFVRRYRNRILNVHPALLPAFPGLDAQQQAVEYGAKYSGCTVHFVDEGVDTGPIIIQAAVKVLDDDTADTLAKRILRKEHIIYPQAVGMVASGVIKIVGRRTVADRDAVG